MNLAVGAWLIAVAAGSVGLAVESNQVRNWTRDVTGGGRLTDYPGQPLVLLFTSSIDGHLSASYGYQLAPGRSMTTLRGKRTSNGGLAPLVTYEIAIERTTNWKKIAELGAGGRTESVTVDSSQPRLALDVDMEPFRPYIGRATWGRVVLENGDAGPFALEDLLPTGDNADTAGNFKQEIVDDEPRRLGSSFKLISVVSIKGRLIGNFIFIGEPEGSSIELVGKETEDTHFWPVCTFQAGNSDNDWKTLQSAREQEASNRLTVYNGSTWKELRVPLDAFAGADSNLKYGKVVFSQDRYAVIRLTDLRPRDAAKSQCSHSPGKAE